MHRFIAATFLFLVLGSAAHAALPPGVTCEQIVRYASVLKIPNTIAGRAQARIIALTYGHWLTNAELNAAAKCLSDARGAR